MADSRSLLTSDQLDSALVVSAKEQEIEPVATPSHSHNPNAPTECMPVFLTGGLDSVPELILSYGDGDFDSSLDEKGSEKYSIEKRQKLTLFGKNILDLMALRVANLVLSADEKSVEEALTIVNKNPSLVRYIVITTDDNGNTVQGTPLQIAAMAGDVDLQEEISPEKNRGIVERLASASGLSKEEVKKQLHVITSVEAKQENEKRNQRILKVIIDFGNSILKAVTDDNIALEDLKKLCQPIIDQLEVNLKPDPGFIITSGYIFDPRILSEAAKWFKENVNRFGGYYSHGSDLLCISGFGKLQKMFSARDFQIIRAGICHLVDEGIIPPRVLIDKNLKSRTGVHYYIGFNGTRWHCAAMTDFVAPMVRKRIGWVVEAWEGLEKLMSDKDTIIAGLCKIKPGYTNACL
jgi:hypothetical protein